MKTAIPVRRNHFLVFLREWMAFALSYPEGTNMDGVTHNFIDPRYGLCGNFRRYLEHVKVISKTNSDWYTSYYGWLSRQFERDGLDGYWPFTEAVYDEHIRTNTHHWVEARIDWVQNYLEKHSQ